MTHVAHRARHDELAWDAQASPVAVSVLTRLVRDWVSRHPTIGVERAADLALCTSEALSNCAEHAYQDHPQHGLMTLRVHYDTSTDAIQVSITDRGQWVGPDDGAVARGRGLMLMRALADDCVVRGNRNGTAVRLRFSSRQWRADDRSE